MMEGIAMVVAERQLSAKTTRLAEQVLRTECFFEPG